ncbi:MAG: sugar phosphate isomerase/epimerase [Thermoprotei archaeon]|nr:sugar phosphate isomerase/epimerase [Thermoproteales archaeon]RLE84788.1 MAG: sugar phosphate isomerase/epimerase [Thermoprotei archaeon]RLE97100.1 MAG: sugar phosphate isomerase/epimerase [Thermoprotei archaeon]
MGEIRLAISGQQLGGFGKPLREILETIKKYGVSWVELWTFNISPEPRFRDEDVRRAIELLEEYKVGVACVTNGAAFDKAYAEAPDKYIEFMKETIRVAKELGAGIVNCYCYYFALGHDADIKPFVKVMKPIVEYAEKMEVTVVLENEAHDASGTPEGMLKILKAVDSEFFRTNFDFTNYYHACVEPFPYAYEILKDYIAYIHAKNGCRYIPGVHPDYAKGAPFAPPLEKEYIFYPPLPHGAVNVEGLIERLKKDGYRGFCTLEPHVSRLDKLLEYYEIEVAYLKQKGIT